MLNTEHATAANTPHLYSFTEQQASTQPSKLLTLDPQKYQLWRPCCELLLWCELPGSTSRLCHKVTGLSLQINTTSHVLFTTTTCVWQAPNANCNLLFVTCCSIFKPRQRARQPCSAIIHSTSRCTRNDGQSLTRPQGQVGCLQLVQPLNCGSVRLKQPPEREQTKCAHQRAAKQGSAPNQE